MSLADKFAMYVQETDSFDQRPIFTEGGFTFVYIRYNNLFFMALTKVRPSLFAGLQSARLRAAAATATAARR